ncbi:hypothetical protein LSAT2_017638 [Lamellibrachia satsuma]|nr:hypothetical protein LSAT2_017638 [Lamellibrachia satsuma]
MGFWMSPCHPMYKDIRKFFGGKTNTCNSKTTEKKPTKVTKESRRSKTNRQRTKVNVKTSGFVSKENVCSKETGSDLSAVVTRRSIEDNETNNNNDSQKTVSEPDGRRSKQSEAKEKGRAEINGKSPTNVKGHKENKKITAKCETMLPDEEETVTIIDGSDDEVQKKPTKKSKLRKRYTSNKNASDEEVQRKPTKRSKSTKDLSDESDEEVQRRPTKKSKSTKDLFDESDEEVQRRPKKKLKSRKGGVIFDSDSGEEDPLPTSHKKTPRRRKKKEVRVVLDSGDEFEPIKQAFAKMTPKIKSPSKPKTSPPKQKPVNVLDFFGMAAVQQEERKMVATKRKSEASLEQGDKSVEEHDDSDFERTLEQLDNTSPRKKIKLDLEESADTGNVSAVSSLSSKLASRAKHFVEETPEKPLSQRAPHFANRGSTVDLTSSPVKNSGDLLSMQQAVLASLYHVADDAWFKYSLDPDNFKHKHGLPEAIVQLIEPIYDDLSDATLLSTQNNNECLNKLIWDRCSKEVFVGPQTVEEAVYSAIGQFNDVNASILSLFQYLGQQPGVFTTAHAVGADTMRLYGVKHKSSESAKKRRKVLRVKRKGFQDKKEQEEIPMRVGLTHDMECIKQLTVSVGLHIAP